MFEGQIEEYLASKWWESAWNCALEQAGYFIAIGQEMAKSLELYGEESAVSESHIIELLERLDYFDSLAEKDEARLIEFNRLAIPRKRLERGFIDWLKASLTVQSIYLNISRNSFVLFLKARSGLLPMSQALSEIENARSGGFELTQSTPKTLDIMQKTSGWPSRELMNFQRELNRSMGATAKLQRLERILSEIAI